MDSIQALTNVLPKTVYYYLQPTYKHILHEVTIFLPSLCSLFFILVTLSACSDDGDTQDNANLILLYWEQTLCFDPWDTGAGDTESETRSALGEYLKEKGIEEFNITRFEDTLEAGVAICAACHCKNGILIYVEVDEKYEEQMEELGFIRS